MDKSPTPPDTTPTTPDKSPPPPDLTPDTPAIPSAPPVVDTRRVHYDRQGEARDASKSVELVWPPTAGPRTSPRGEAKRARAVDQATRHGAKINVIDGGTRHKAQLRKEAGLAKRRAQYDAAHAGDASTLKKALDKGALTVTPNLLAAARRQGTKP